MHVVVEAFGVGLPGVAAAVVVAEESWCFPRVMTI